jgi:hypothetical protein
MMIVSARGHGQVEARQHVIAIADPSLAGYRVGNPSAEAGDIRPRPTGSPERAIEVNHRQLQLSTQSPRQRRLAASGTTQDHDSPHREILEASAYKAKPRRGLRPAHRPKLVAARRIWR